jgi:hypothetical protein
MEATQEFVFEAGGTWPGRSIVRAAARRGRCADCQRECSFWRPGAEPRPLMDDLVYSDGSLCSLRCDGSSVSRRWSQIESQFRNR